MSLIGIMRRVYWRLRWGARVGTRTLVDSRTVVMHIDGGSIEIGQRCRIHRHVLIAPYGGSIKIGNGVSINPFSVIYGHGGLVIGNDVRIATHVVIVPMNHGFDDPNTPIRKQPIVARGIRIGDDVWIGAGARILDGVDIAKGCVIGAGAVVTKSTVPYGIYGGVPARLLRLRGARTACDGPPDPMVR